MRVLLHFPAFGEPPDIAFWLEAGRVRSESSGISAGTILARMAVGRIRRDVAWDEARWADYCLQQAERNPSLHGYWEFIDTDSPSGELWRSRKPVGADT